MMHILLLKKKYRASITRETTPFPKFLEKTVSFLTHGLFQPIFVTETAEGNLMILEE